MKTFYAWITFFLFITHISVGQIEIYAGLDVGGALHIPKRPPISNIGIRAGTEGLWGAIVGINLADKWLIETGYAGFLNSHSYKYEGEYASGFYTLHLPPPNQFHGSWFPIRAKRKLDFKLFRNNFSFLPSVGIIFLNTSPNDDLTFDSNYQTILKNTNDTLTLFNAYTRNIERSQQFFLEIGTSIETPFILRPLSIFFKASYAFGLSNIARSNYSYQVVELNDMGNFQVRHRLSYLYASLGFRWVIEDFKTRLIE